MAIRGPLTSVLFACLTFIDVSQMLCTLVTCPCVRVRRIASDVLAVLCHLVLFATSLRGWLVQLRDTSHCRLANYISNESKNIESRTALSRELGCVCLQFISSFTVFFCFHYSIPFYRIVFFFSCFFLRWCCFSRRFCRGARRIFLRGAGRKRASRLNSSQTRRIVK